jgi:hypothetical protein
MTVSTQAPSALLPSTRRFAPPSRRETREVAVVWATGLCVLLLAARRQRRRWSTVLGLVVFAMIAFAAGCGSGGPSTPKNPGTPVGNYNGVTVTVTINGVTESINNLSVSVE